MLAGMRKPDAGSASVLGDEPATLSARRLVKAVGLVPQNPQLLLYGESVEDECSTSDREGALAHGTTARVLEGLLPGMPMDRHPRDLSEGQRLTLAMAVVLSHEPPLLLLDEPTRGLDYPSKERLERTLTELASKGTAVVIATHDVELVARVANRAVLLADGEVVADGPAREVVCHSPVFSPQVAKVLAPGEWLTVDEVRAALDAADLIELA
jgi:energy-coupling factor transport system ATP-binding protein